MVTKIVKLDQLAKEEATLAPAYAGRAATAPVPKFELPDNELDPTIAYRLIHDELMLDGNARLNLATFVTIWMEPEAEKLMAETFDKNMIDKDEYPQTAAIEERCINMVAHLFHSPEHEEAVGASAIGSSEAVMLARVVRRRFTGGRLGRPLATSSVCMPAAPGYASLCCNLPQFEHSRQVGRGFDVPSA